MDTLRTLSQGLARGEVTSRSLIEAALEKIEDAAGEGERVFIDVTPDTVRSEADKIDRLRAAGHAMPPFAGIPLAIKDLFDVSGQVTRAGSRVLAKSLPAKVDAPAISRLRAAGFVFIGRTNMTEFAYSGLGLNPHYGTPRNPFDRQTGRIPGGSTSGGAVAVTDGMSAASIGSDTGGSCRIPAALTGIVGFKPTAHRVSREGTIPLSQTLDSIGPLARSVDCCASLDAIMSGAEPYEPGDRSLDNVRLLLPTTVVLADMDEFVARTFEGALDRLSSRGVAILPQPLPELQRILQTNAAGGFAAAESYAWHRPLLGRHADDYDPRVVRRILKGRDSTDAHLQELHRERSASIHAIDAAASGFDAMIMPTVPVIAPPISAFQNDSEYQRLNALMLRNASYANYLDRCSISLPIHDRGEPPVGLMLIGRHDEDEQLFVLARAIERALGARSMRLPRQG
jgi:aspartyl-tRNA(Asn)/glutamyl-tRNA(Gln) amidotransferase subunit A